MCIPGSHRTGTQKHVETYDKDNLLSRGQALVDVDDSTAVDLVLKPGEQATAEELTAFCRERLAPYKIPRVFEFREALPKTTIGKVLRRQLRDEALAETAPAS